MDMTTIFAAVGRPKLCLGEMSDDIFGLWGRFFLSDGFWCCQLNESLFEKMDSHAFDGRQTKTQQD